MAAAGLVSLPVGATTPPPFQIGMWLRLNKRRGEEEWRQYFELLTRAGVQSILPQVYQNRSARYESKVLPVQRGILETILPLATEAGLQVHGWMHTMLCNVPTVLREHPEWFAVSASGKSTADNPPYTQHYRFLCPTRPAVCRFLLSIVAELCAYDDLSGVHLDFVRHPDVFLPAKFARKRNQPSDRVLPDNDFCYCEVCLATFKKETGFAFEKEPSLEVQEAWAQFRLEKMTKLVSALAARCRKSNKKISAAVFPTPALSRKMVRQAWDTWPLDAAMPMAYHSNYEQPLSWIEETTRISQVEVAGRFPVHTGLLMSSISASDALAAIEFVRRGGAQGVTLFNANQQDLELLAKQRASRAGSR